VFGGSTGPSRGLLRFAYTVRLGTKRLHRLLPPRSGEPVAMASDQPTARTIARYSRSRSSCGATVSELNMRIPHPAGGAPCRTVYGSADGKIANTRTAPLAVGARRAARRSPCRFRDDARAAAQGGRLGADALAAVAGGGKWPSAGGWATTPRGQALTVFWDCGLDRRFLQEEGWANLGQGFDSPRDFAAFFNTLRWNLRHSYRSGHLPSALPRRHPADAYQMEVIPSLSLTVAGQPANTQTVRGFRYCGIHPYSALEPSNEVEPPHRARFKAADLPAAKLDLLEIYFGNDVSS